LDFYIVVCLVVDIAVHFAVRRNHQIKRGTADTAGVGMIVKLLEAEKWL
jgi:hypothetical protein